MLFTILSAGDGYTSMIVAGIAGLDRHLPGQDTSGSSSRISMYMNYSRVFERVLIRSPRGVEVVVKDLFCFRVQQLGVALDRAGSKIFGRHSIDHPPILDILLPSIDRH
jgi:hypothetical protein